MRRNLDPDTLVLAAFAVAAVLMWVQVRRWRDGAGPAPFILGLLPTVLLVPALVVLPAAWSLTKSLQDMAVAGVGGPRVLSRLSLLLTQTLSISALAVVALLAVAMLLQFFEGPAEPDEPLPAVDDAPPVRPAGWLFACSPVLALLVAGLFMFARSVPRLLLDTGPSVMQSMQSGASNAADLRVVSELIAGRLLMTMTGGVVVSALLLGLVGVHVFRPRATVTSTAMDWFGWIAGFAVAAGVIWILMILRADVAWMQSQR